MYESIRERIVNYQVENYDYKKFHGVMNLLDEHITGMVRDQRITKDQYRDLQEIMRTKKEAVRQEQCDAFNKSVVYDREGNAIPWSYVHQEHDDRKEMRALENRIKERYE